MMEVYTSSKAILIFGFYFMLSAPACAESQDLAFELESSLSETSLRICAKVSNLTEGPVLFPGPFHFNRGGTLVDELRTATGDPAIKWVPSHITGGGYIPSPLALDRLGYELLQSKNELSSCAEYDLDLFLVEEVNIKVTYSSWLGNREESPFSSSDLLVYKLLLTENEMINLGECSIDLTAQTSVCSE